MARYRPEGRKPKPVEAVLDAKLSFSPGGAGVSLRIEGCDVVHLHNDRLYVPCGVALPDHITDSEGRMKVTWYGQSVPISVPALHKAATDMADSMGTPDDWCADRKAKLFALRAALEGKG